MKEIRNRNKIGFNPIVFFKAPVSHKLYRQLTSLMMSIVIFMVTIFGNSTVTFADKKDDIVNRIIEQYQNGDISRDEAKRALIRNGVTNSPIIDLNEDEEGNEIATDSDLVKKLGEKDRLIDEKIRKIIEDNRDDDTSVVFAWHHEDADSIIDELSDVATKSELKKSEADDNQESKKSVGIYYDKFNKTNKSSENADSKTESENIEEAVDNEDDAAVDEESVSEGEVSDENQASEEMTEDDSLDEDEENEDYNSVDEDEVFENDSQDKESEDFDSAEEDEVSENDSQDDENETIESVEENEGFENNSQDEEAEVSESLNPYEFFMNQFQNEETEVSDSVEEDEVSEDDSQDEEDEEEDSDSVEEDEVLGKEEENSDSVETAEADENESEDEEKEENSNLIKVDKFFEIDSYVENEDSDSENSEEETTEAETEAAKAIGIMAHSDKNAIAQTAEDAEAEVDADAEIEAETETKAAKAIGILAHSEKTATAQTEETTEAAEEEKDYDVIDLSEYVTVSSAVKKFHEEWIESESFDSGNKIGLTLYFSIPKDVMYDKDTRVAAYSMPEGLSSQFAGTGKVISGDETVGTYKLKKNEIEITFDTAFVKSGKSIEGALFFKGRVENKTEEDCLTIELGGTAGSLDVYKEISKTVVSDDGKVRVTATFGASTFDGNVTLHADSLDEETKLDVENAYNEKFSKKEHQVSNLYLYDVYFLDDEGAKIEPDGHVSVKMTFTEPVESGEDEEVKVLHVKNNDLSDIEDLTSMDDTVINENSKGAVKNVELVTDSFSIMGIVIDGTPVDISKFLSSLSITGVKPSSDGKSWTLKDKTPYTLFLTFNEVTNGDQFPDDTTWMYYDLPADLYTEDKVTTFDVIIDYTYTISGNILAVDSDNGKLYFQWNTKDDNFKHLMNATNVKITAELTGSVNSKPVYIQFPNDVTKTIKVDKYHKVDIWKEGQYNAESDRIIYKLHVYSNGVSENVVVTDTIIGSLIHLDQDSPIEITSDKVGVDNCEISKHDKGFTVKIPKMRHDENITITYKAKFGDIPKDATTSIDTTGNSVKIKADNDAGYETYPITIKLSSLSKGGYLHSTVYTDEDGKNYSNIEYTIEANSERITDLSYIIDTIEENSRQYLSYSGNGLQVYINGSNEYIEVPWTNPNLKSDYSDGKAYRWTWNIPDKYKTGEYKNASFKIKYTTKFDRSKLTESVTVKNSVETNHSDTSPTATVSIEPNKHNFNISKTALSHTNDKIVWQLSFDVPAEGLNYCRINEYLPYKGDFYDSLDKEQSIIVSGLTGNETWTTSEPEVIPHNNWLGKEGYYFNIIFFKDANGDITTKDKSNSNNGLTSTKDPRTITITLTSKVNQNWLDYTSTESNYEGHKNSAEFYLGDFHNWAECNVNIYCNLKKTGGFKNDYVYRDGKSVYTRYLTEDGYYILYYDILISGLEKGKYPNGLTLTDTYDEHLSFFEGSSYFPDHKHIYAGPNIWWQDWDKGEAEFTVDEDNHTLTIRIPDIPVDENNEYYGAYNIRYYLKIKETDAIKAAIDTETDDIATFSNKVEWNGFSSNCDVKFEHKVLDKKGKYDQDTGLASYEIEINPNKDTLNNGEVMTLEDIFTNQNIDISTIEITLDGKVTEGKYHIEGSTLTFYNIPDQTNVVIKYKAMPIFDQSNSVNITNTAKLLKKVKTFEDTATFEIKGAGSGNTCHIKIVKHKKGEESTKLAGAVFDLYKVEDNDSLTPLTYTDGDNNVKTIQFTTGENGVCEISLVDYKEAFAYGQTYCLVESKAPDGYRVDDDNVYYFGFADPEKKEQFKYSSKNPRYPSGYVLMISNEENKLFALPDTGSIGVNIMYLMGTLMVTLGGFILTFKRRKENQF